MNVDRRAQADHGQQPWREPGDRTQHLARRDAAAIGDDAGYPRTGALVLELDGYDFRVLMDLGSPLIGATPVAPGYRVVTGDRARGVIKRPHHRRVAAAGHVHHRDRGAHGLAVDRLTRDAEVLVDLGTPAHRAPGGNRAREPEMAAGAVGQIQVEIL